MTLPQLTFADVENAALDVVVELLGAHEPDVAVRLGVPDGWQPSDGLIVSVEWDGTPSGEHPVSMTSAIRVTVRPGKVPSEAKRLALLVRGLLLGYSGPVLRAIRPGAGPQPATEPYTQQEIWWFTVNVTTFAVPITPSS